MTNAPPTVTTTGTGATEVHHPSPWTPQVVLGFSIALIALIALVYIGVTTDDPGLRGQVVIALTGVVSAASTYFLGNMQRTGVATSTGAGSAGPSTTVNTQNADVDVRGPGAHLLDEKPPR